ncbi:MAG: hypothetical protein M3P43_04965 [Actinomycetota bacterium]|nr:hypothetical protein [Actinomycetota bacterium]
MPDDCLTICAECGIVFPLDGPYGFAPHVIRFHPNSPLADLIRQELNRKGSPLGGGPGTPGVVVPFRRRGKS